MQRTDTFNYSNVNSEIKSHSSVLFNERIHVKLYILETDKVSIKANPTIKGVMHLKSIIEQIWTEVRTLIFYDESCRKTLGLDTDVEGVYTLDIAVKKVDDYVNFLLNYPESINYHYLNVIIKELNSIESAIRNILQYFKYFIRFDKPQKPDIDKALEKYKNNVDQRTLLELQEVMGSNALFNKIGYNDKELDDDFFDEYDEEVDGEDE